MPTGACTSQYPPILFEVQQKVDMSFVKRLIQYGLSISTEHKVAPIVLMLPVSSGTMEVSRFFGKPAPIQPLFVAPNQVGWCKQAYLCPMRQKEQMNEINMSPIEAIGFFLQAKARSVLAFRGLKGNATVRLLFEKAYDRAYAEGHLEMEAVEAIHEISGRTAGLLVTLKEHAEAGNIGKVLA